MSKLYNLLPTEILDRLYNYNHKGCTETEMVEAEQRLGTKVPEYLRNYYLKYSDLSLSKCLNFIADIQYLNFTYNYLEDEKEEWEETFEETIDEIKARVDNYLTFWNENQGVWNAGILADDIEKENPPIWMTTNDSMFDTWAVASNSFNSFILSMLWDNSTNCDDFDFKKSCNEHEILEVIKANNIDIAQLTPTYNKHCTTCWDDEQKTMFMFINREGKGKISEMRILSVQ